MTDPSEARAALAAQKAAAKRAYRKLPQAVRARMRRHGYKPEAIGRLMGLWDRPGPRKNKRKGRRTTPIRPPGSRRAAPCCANTPDPRRKPNTPGSMNGSDSECA